MTQSRRFRAESPELNVLICMFHTGRDGRAGDHCWRRRLFQHLYVWNHWMLFGEYISKQPTIFQMFVATQFNILNKTSGQFPAMLMSTKPDISDMTQQFPAVFVETTRRFLKRRLAIFKPCLWQQNPIFLTRVQDNFQMCLWQRDQMFLMSWDILQPSLLQQNMVSLTRRRDGRYLDVLSFHREMNQSECFALQEYSSVTLLRPCRAVGCYVTRSVSWWTLVLIVSAPEGSLTHNLVIAQLLSLPHSRNITN